MRNRLRLLVWCLALAAMLAASHPLPRIDAADLAFADPDLLVDVWLVAARWAVAAAAWYLAVGTIVVAVAEVTRTGWLLGASDRLVAARLRRSVRAGLGAGLAISIGLGPAGPSVAAPGPPGTDPGWASSLQLPVDGGRSPDVASARQREHEVVPGESFWSIAADLAATDLGRPPSDAEVASVWLPLIDANRDRLVVPSDPDLLLPGQRLALPGRTAVVP